VGKKTRAPSLTQENLSGIIDGENCLTLRTTETPRSRGFELFIADGAREYFGENGGRSRLVARLEKGGRLFQIVFNIEELGKAEKLEDLVYLGLDLEKDDISAPGLHCLEEGGKRTDARRGDVIETAAVEDEAYEACVDRFSDALLEKIGVIRIDIACKEEGETIIHGTDFLKTDFKAIVFFVVESGNDIVIVHDAPLNPTYAQS
jgi:hypothetical protein